MDIWLEVIFRVCPSMLNQSPDLSGPIRHFLRPLKSQKITGNRRNKQITSKGVNNDGHLVRRPLDTLSIDVQPLSGPVRVPKASKRDLRASEWPQTCSNSILMTSNDQIMGGQ